MEPTIHPLAPDHLPFFVTGPGESDQMMMHVAIFLVVAVLLLGVLYLVLHSLPERMAHKKKAAQLQLISILVLLALFTHQNIFWLAALILVVLDIPDIMSPLNSIARSLETATGREAVAAASEPTVAPEQHAPPPEPEADSPEATPRV